MEELFTRLFGNGDDAVLIFGGAMAMLSVLMVTGVAASLVRSRIEVRRRAAESAVAPAGSRDSAGNGGLAAGRDTLEAMLAALAKRFVDGTQDNSRVLKAQLIQAGFFQPMAPVWFFIARFVMLGIAGLVGFLGLPLVFAESTFSSTLLYAAVSSAIGYMSPGVFLARRIAGRIAEIRAGFPDFMDLMVVCGEAGLSMEASLERVSRELAAAYPALSENLFITCLEIRAGRTVAEALERLAQRSGVPEAKSFATLLQQSEELGSSITQSLKVYSDDMRNKRMMRAEEKAYALPAKLVVPLTMFVFPVLLVTLLLPVVIRMMAVE